MLTEMPDKMAESIVVFYFSCIPYNHLYQRPQQLFREWRSNFEDSYEFYYVDFPTFSGFVMNSVQMLQRSMNKRLFNEASTNDSHILKGFIYPPRGIGRYRLPRWAVESSLSFKACNAFVRKTLDNCCSSIQKRVAIVASPFWEPFVSRSEFDLVCYDYLDAIDVSATLFSYNAWKKRHERLVAKSDVVFVTAEKLGQGILSIANDKAVVPVSNGTDIDFFESNKELHQILDYVKKNKKTVGYIGALSSWVDLDLVYGTAQELPEVDFILVGPFDPRTKSYIKSKPKNVFVLGAKEYAQIPSYINIFDACIIPFKPGPISDSTDPVKLYEYFSLGKPVVATNLKALEEYDDGHLLKTARTADEFADAINFFLTYDSPEWQASRRCIARQNSWRSKAATIISSVESKLSEKPGPVLRRSQLTPR
jgi:glycosyltransferase involved in cell wall biosynthesis